VHVKAVLYLTLIAVAGLTIRVDLFASSDTQQNILNPRGKIHIPIGIANSLDTLKTFVDPAIVMAGLTVSPASTLAGFRRALEATASISGSSIKIPAR
jgi:hypothetical protein